MSAIYRDSSHVEHANSADVSAIRHLTAYYRVTIGEYSAPSLANVGMGRDDCAQSRSIPLLAGHYVQVTFRFADVRNFRRA